MKNLCKKIITLGLVACMLAGCGNTASEKNSSQAGQTVGQSESVETSAYPEYLNLESARPVVKEGHEVTLKVAIMRGGDATGNYEDLWFPKFIEEELNIKLDIEEVTSEGQAERKNLMFASDDLPDLVLGIELTNADVVKYGVADGQLLALSDYLSEELTPNIIKTLEEYPEAAQSRVASDGKMYILPKIRPNFPGQGDTVGTARMFIDTTYMEAIGLEEAPTTLDGFVDMLRAFKALDPSTMGVDTIYPLVSVSGLEHRDFKNAFGWVAPNTNDFTTPCWDMETGEVVVPALQEKFVDYVKLLHTLYSEGLLHPDYYTLDNTAAKGIMSEGKVPVMGIHAPYLVQEERFAEYIAVSPMTSQWSETAIATQSDSFQASCAYVSADTEYPEVIMRLLDYLFTEEGSVYAEKGPVAGSDDCLDAAGGFFLGEDGAIQYKDVLAGKYKTIYENQVDGIMMAYRLPFNQNYETLYQQTMLGIEDPQYPELDLTNPDDHYRYLIYNAQNAYLVPKLPDFYATEEQSVRYTDLKTVLDSHISAEMAKFVVGQRPIEEVDQLLEELKSMNGEEYLALCKEFYANYTR